MSMHRIWFLVLLAAHLTSLRASVDAVPANTARNAHTANAFLRTDDDILSAKNNRTRQSFFASVHRSHPVSRPNHAALLALSFGVSHISRIQARQNGDGLNFSPCSTSSDCIQPRRCLNVCKVEDNSVEECSAASDCCECISFRSCASNDDCDEGEQCAANEQFCGSSEALQSNCEATIPNSNETAGVSVYGLTADACSTDSDCAGGRQCLGSRGGRNQPCDASFFICICFPDAPVFCASDSACVAGETCQLWPSVSDRLCLSNKLGTLDSSSNSQESIECGNNNVENSSGGSSKGDDDNDDENEGGMCIAVHSLAHMKPEELLFTQARRTQVLCDANNSCATAGHMVSFNGQLMMMKTYCEMSGCSRRRMYVNSPRFRRALRVESNTEALLFTALAARYESVAEERVLSAAIRCGLL